jgi:hypothetical protein
MAEVMEGRKVVMVEKDQEKYVKIFHEKVSEFIDTRGFGDDADAVAAVHKLRRVVELVHEARALQAALSRRPAA